MDLAFRKCEVPDKAILSERQTPSQVRHMTKVIPFSVPEILGEFDQVTRNW